MNYKVSQPKGRLLNEPGSVNKPSKTNLGGRVATPLKEPDLVPGNLYEIWHSPQQNPVYCAYVFLAMDNKPSNFLHRTYGDVSLGGIIAVELGTMCTYIQKVQNSCNPPASDDLTFDLLEVICSHGIVYTTADQLRPYKRKPPKL